MLTLDLEDSKSFLATLISLLDEPSDISFQKEYEEFVDGINSLWDTQSVLNENPLMYCIYEAKKITSSIETLDQEETELRFNKHGLDAIFLGRVIQELKDAPIIRPSGNQVKNSLGEIYAHDLLFSDEYWDTFFELDIAAHIKSIGIPTYLIAEGQESGPDIKILFEDEEIWVECKRKRKYTEKERAWRSAESKLDQCIWNHDELGFESFALKINSEYNLKDKHISSLADNIVQMINKKKFNKEINVEGDCFNLQLHDISPPDTETKAKDMVFTKVDYDFKREDPNEKLPLPQPDGSYKLDIRNGGYYKFGDRISKNREEVYEVNHIVDFDVPWKIDFHKRLENTIKSGRSRLSGFSPGVLMIDIPQRWKDLMEEKTARTPDGDNVLQAKRLKGICKKEFKDSDSLNAISIKTRIWDIFNIFKGLRGESQGRYTEIVKRRNVRTYRNISPKTKLPKTFLTDVIRF